MRRVAWKPRIQGRRLAWGFAALVGYILSPLSPWNDAFVNIPIALAAAKTLHRLIGLSEPIGFQIGYIASNVLGTALMLLAGMEATGRGGTGKRTMLKQIVVSIMYSLAAAAVLTAAGVLSP